MYTGTLISDLMKTAEQVERNVEQQRIDEELHQIFMMQIPVTDQRAFMGAA